MLFLVLVEYVIIPLVKPIISWKDLMMIMRNKKTFSKAMAFLFATVLITSFSFGTADACYGGQEGTKGCSSGVSVGVSHGTGSSEDQTGEKNGSVSETISEECETVANEVK